MNLHPAIRCIALAVVLWLLTVSSARAGDAAFSPLVFTGVSASTSEGGPNGQFDEDRDSALDAAGAPATAQATVSNGSASASANFTELKAFARFDGGVVSTSDFATAGALLQDTIMIEVPGSPAGTTRLELTWQLDGTLGGNGRVRAFSSDYRTDAAGQGFPDLSAGSFSTNTPGPVSQPVTFVYDAVPIGLPWNMQMNLLVDVRNGMGLADFNRTATLNGIEMFVDDVPVQAVITGASGASYEAQMMVTLLGDANNDQQVTGQDLIVVQQNFGKAGPPNDGTLPGDANDDGLVTGQDLITVQQNFGKAAGAAAVPEPAVAGLLLCGLVVSRRSSRRMR